MWKISFAILIVTTAWAQPPTGAGIGPGGSPRPGQAGVYRAGGGVTSPSVLSKTEPQYSEEARKAGAQGAVVVSLVVRENGIPTDLHVSSPAGMGLDEAAIDAVRQWQFKPGTKEGTPVPVRATIEVNFRLLGAGMRPRRIVFDDPAQPGRPVVRGSTPIVLSGEAWQTPFPKCITARGILQQDGSLASIRIDPVLSEQTERDFVNTLSRWSFEPATGTVRAEFCMPDAPKQNAAMPVLAPSVAMTPPRVLEKREPELTEEARKAGVDTQLRLTVEIGEDGLVRRATVAQPIGLGLDESAIDTVKTWKFAPAMADGTPKPFRSAVEVIFRVMSPASLAPKRVVFDGAPVGTRPVLTHVEPIAFSTRAQASALPRCVAVHAALNQDGRLGDLRFDPVIDPGPESELAKLLGKWRFAPANGPVILEFCNPR